VLGNAVITREYQYGSNRMASYDWRSRTLEYCQLRMVLHQFSVVYDDILRRNQIVLQAHQKVDWDIDSVQRERERERGISTATARTSLKVKSTYLS